MTTESTWAATRRLAEAWSRSPVVQNYIAQLPANNTSDRGIPEMLRNIDSSTGLVSHEPLIPNKWKLMAPELPFVDLNVRGGRQFLEDAQPIGFAAECNTAWIRSRLPRFPLIPTPQLGRNTHRTSNELGHGLGWRREAMTGGLQLLSAPPNVAELLRIDKQVHDSAAIGLAEALAKTPEWNNFAQLSARLTPDDRAALSEARKSLAPHLNAQAVDTFEPDRMLRREQYRKDTVDSVIEQLTGTPAEFALAFEKIDELIDLVTLTVLGQLIAYGRPKVVLDPRNLEREGRNLTFSSATTSIGRAALLKFDDPIVSDCALVTGFSIHSDETGDVQDRYTAVILPNSHDSLFHESEI
ncbi:MAG: hypothetical protein U5O16_00030 [Rhodococcus sp. (in: high G+C Gram-positive bacteria)]|uniref:hypothetical protein n=1 Tax=Rhodococcus sp. TaxID=1831 RepID=UPI002AD6052F|nr:hypothetical protein [Rhodococcus sp. (in: high G+C Gram-positive bacteria)]